MRRLVKLQKPEVLVTNESAWTVEYVEKVTNGEKPPTRWRHPEIKATLSDETNERCAYCDSVMAVVNFPHVEHILPKSKFPDLVVAWQNLTLVCEKCNVNKLDYYSDITPLLDPYNDDPHEHLLFLGHLIVPRPGSDRGLMTVQRLGLSRQALTSQRLQRVERLLSLIENWARAESVDVKAELLSIIAEDVKTGPYQNTAYAIVDICNIDLT